MYDAWEQCADIEDEKVMVFKSVDKVTLADLYLDGNGRVLVDDELHRMIRSVRRMEVSNGISSKISEKIWAVFRQM